MSNRIIEFNTKYSFESHVWLNIDQDATCEKCSSEIYSEEIVLDMVTSYYCTRCGIDLYKTLENNEPEKIIEESKETIEYKTIDSSWIILSQNKCYFCGKLTYACEHVKRLNE